jgi:hypothetical protein
MPATIYSPTRSCGAGALAREKAGTEGFVEDVPGC